MSRAIVFSFVGHLLVGGFFFVATSGHRENGGVNVYNVSIVPGVAFPGGGSGAPGSGGKAPVGIAGMVGKPGMIGGPALPPAKPLKGTTLVEPVKKNRKPGKPADATNAERRTTNDDISLRVYGSGGTIGGGGGPGGGPGGGSGRPATAFEVAMNSKILPNWNEELWKAQTDRLTCTIAFLIAADGTVSGIQIFEPSGNTEFDQAARRAIEISTLPAPTTFGITGNIHEARVTFVNRPD